MDGRNTRISNYEQGSFVRPTILSDLPHNSEVARIETFGPVLGLIHVETI